MEAAGQNGATLSCCVRSVFPPLEKSTVLLCKWCANLLGFGGQQYISPYRHGREVCRCKCTHLLSVVHSTQSLLKKRALGPGVLEGEVTARNHRCNVFGRCEQLLDPVHRFSLFRWVSWPAFLGTELLHGLGDFPFTLVFFFSIALIFWWKVERGTLSNEALVSILLFDCLIGCFFFCLMMWEYEIFCMKMGRLSTTGKIQSGLGSYFV